MQRKTVIVTSYHPLISRNIISSDILPLLQKEGVRIVIIVHEKQKEYFQEHFANEHTIIEAVDPASHRSESFLRLISMGLVTPYNLFLRSLWKEGRYGKVLFARTIYYLFSKFFFVKKLFRWVVRKTTYTNAFQAIFEKYNPDLVFATDLFFSDDIKLIEEAKRTGIKTIGMVRSWDNITTRGVLLAVPNTILVHNEVIKDEMIAYNRVPEDRIFIVGVPHYDEYITPPSISKEEFYKEMGLDIRKKTIFFAPGGRMQYKCDGEILKMFKELKDTNVFGYPVQYLVRQQPGDKMELNGFDPDKDPDIVIDTPGINLTGRKKSSEITKKDEEELKASLYYSDIVITLLSTIAIDSAVMNRPVIIIGFDPKGCSIDTVRKFTKYKHMKKFFGWGLLTISKSREEFIRDMSNYMENPQLHHEKRKALVQKYAYKVDGNSSERVAEVLLKEVE